MSSRLELPKSYRYLVDDRIFLDDAGNNIAPDVFRSRFVHLFINLQDLLDLYSLSGCCTINPQLLWKAVLDYFADIARMKEFHGHNHVQMDKVISFETYWLLKNHPIQNLANPEETSLDTLLQSYTTLTFYWMCGDAHNNRQSRRDYIRVYQVGSLTSVKGSIPDFAIYDTDSAEISRKVFRFLRHLNSPAKSGKAAGGWKRVHIDPKAISVYYDETLD